jgi:pre-mRNA-splicing factor 38B
MNMNNMLLTNIRVSDYFKLLSEKKTFEDVVDEIYYNVKTACPWVPGTHNMNKTNGMCGAVRGVSAAGRPTSCFTLVFKCFTMKLSATQINTLINHPDSPYIRIVGFLYLRYCCKPEKLWGWYEQYMDDEEEFYMQGEKYGEGDKVKFGPWLRLLLTEMDYHETRLPRIAIPIQNQISAHLEQWDLAHGSSSAAKAGGGAREERRGGGGGGGGGGRDRDAERGRERDGDRDSQRGADDRRRQRSPEPPAAAGGSGSEADWRDSKRFKGNGPPKKEKRQDPDDGEYYTKASFIEVYGGVKQWEAAEETSRK